MEGCKYHFGQAQETELSSTTWEDILENPNIQEEILNGSFDQFGTLSQESREFIKVLRIQKNELKNQVSMNVTLKSIKDWDQGLKEDKS